ncbi:Peptide methionine sulfoxide reductase A5 [Capsicum baccatum]|uniref:peptide-methionine (S)-S-oxide reductase n=1 Tax=Capsicum baccatum TaxID=33114 RepID=A0A2G2X0T0_CAPBA|nr:Peptide methionine sulfoxide reductase A5 [Capsicum baccatum]
MEVAKSAYFSSPFLFHLLFTIILLSSNPVLSIRFPDRILELPKDASNQPVQTAVFALGSFWRSEASFGCLNGILRTTVGYAGGSKPNPEYRNLGDHAECVQIGDTFYEMIGVTLDEEGDEKALFQSGVIQREQYARRVEYDPRVIGFRQLLEVFWASHDSRQVLGKVLMSIIFTNGTEQSRLAAVSKEREQSKSKSGIVTTQIQQFEAFYPAEPEHQKFELKRNPFLLQLMGNLPEEELERSTLATKLNGYAAELCPSRTQRRIDATINDIIKKGWPILRDV